jgi:hypothetical protein
MWKTSVWKSNKQVQKTGWKSRNPFIFKQSPVDNYPQNGVMKTQKSNNESGKLFSLW